MKLAQLLLLAAALLVNAVILGVGVIPASAATADQKAENFRDCRGTGPISVSDYKSCCTFAGGTPIIQTDSNGNVTGMACVFHSDAGQSNQQGVGLANATPPNNRSSIGPLNSSTNSGGHSMAGEYGFSTLSESVIQPPPNTTP